MKIIGENTYRKIHVILLGLIAFTLPFPIILNSGLIILCATLSLIQGHLFKGIKNATKEPYALLLWLFFLLHIISGLLSNNHHEGFAIIERKASLFIFPFLIFSFQLSISEVKKICLFFISGILLAFTICIGYALYRFSFMASGSGVFFYQELASAISMNAVYLSAYSIIALHCVFYFAKEFRKLIVVTISFFLIVFCVLLNSKMMLACLCLGLIIFAFKKLKATTAILFSATVIGCMCLIGISVPKVKERVALEFNSNMAVVKQDTFRYDTPFTGTSLRIVFWRFSKEILMKQNGWVIGVHTGDFQDLLNQKYIRTGIYVGNPELKDTGYLGYGPHNQYIEVLLSLGITGLTIFLALLVYYFNWAWQTDNYLALQCILLFTFFFFSESVLSVNKGIVAFVFFTVLFQTLSPNKKKPDNK
jgi:O-antigen ligase